MDRSLTVFKLLCCGGNFGKPLPREVVFTNKWVGRTPENCVDWREFTNWVESVSLPSKNTGIIRHRASNIWGATRIFYLVPLVFFQNPS